MAPQLFHLADALPHQFHLHFAETVSFSYQELVVFGKRWQKLGKNEADRHNERDQVGTRTRHRTEFGQFEGERAVFARIINAVVRAVLMTFVVAMPSLIVGGSTNSDMILLFAAVAFAMTFFEYFSTFPSLIEFRDAPPFNRLRFVALFSTILLLSLICRGKTDPTALTAILSSLGKILGNAIDFPYSPVRLVVLALPHDASPQLIENVRTASGISYLVSLLTLFVFVTLVRVFNWPIRNGAFNFWVNLPLFDPTAGGDVVYRLRRDSTVNIILGFLLPFMIPAVVKAMSDFVNPVSMENPATLIWTMTAWAFLPASLMMRGIALSRVADMIEEKRKRVYAEADTEVFQTI